MNGLHRGGLDEISIVIISSTLLLTSIEAFFLPMPNCGGCPTIPPCCSPFPSPSGFGTQLFSSYGVGRIFNTPSYPLSPLPSQSTGYALPASPPPHPWLSHLHQHMTLHSHIHPSMFPPLPSLSNPFQLPSPMNPTYTSMTSPPSIEPPVRIDEFVGSSSAYPTDETTTTTEVPVTPQFMYSTDHRSISVTAATLTEESNEYDEATTEMNVSVNTPNVQVDTVSFNSNYLRSKPPKIIHSTSAVPVSVKPVLAASKGTMNWAISTDSEEHTSSQHSFTSQPNSWHRTVETIQPGHGSGSHGFVSFNTDHSHETVQSQEVPPIAAAKTPTTPKPHHTAKGLHGDLSSSELNELDDLDMLLITSDDSFRPVTSKNPAPPITSEELASFNGNITAIAEKLPEDLNDIVFWPIGKDINLLKRAIELRKRRDEEKKKNRSSKSISESGEERSKRKYRSQSAPTDATVIIEDGNSFLASYLRRSEQSGISHRILNAGTNKENRRTESQPHPKQRSARTIARDTIINKLRVMDELLETSDE